MQKVINELNYYHRNQISILSPFVEKNKQAPKKITTIADQYHESFQHDVQSFKPIENVPLAEMMCDGDREALAEICQLFSDKLNGIQTENQLTDQPENLLVNLLVGVLRQYSPNVQNQSIKNLDAFSAQLSALLTKISPHFALFTNKEFLREIGQLVRGQLEKPLTLSELLRIEDESAFSCLLKMDFGNGENLISHISPHFATLFSIPNQSQRQEKMWEIEKIVLVCMEKLEIHLKTHFDIKTRMKFALANFQCFHDDFVRELIACDALKIGNSFPDFSRYAKSMYAIIKSHLPDKFLADGNILFDGEEYKCISPLGDGSAGCVLLYQSENGKQLAIKKSLNHYLPDKDKEVLREASLNYCLSQEGGNHYVIDCKGVIYKGNVPHIVLKKATTDLVSFKYKLKWVVENDILSPYHAGRIFNRIIRDALEAIQYINGRGAFSNDIKMENLLIDSDRPDRPEVLEGRVVIADFDTAVAANPIGKHKMDYGTEEFFAPETIKEGNDGEPEYLRGHGTEIWMLGMTILDFYGIKISTDLNEMREIHLNAENILGHKTYDYERIDKGQSAIGRFLNAALRIEDGRASAWDLMKASVFDDMNGWDEISGYYTVCIRRLMDAVAKKVDLADPNLNSKSNKAKLRKIFEVLLQPIHAYV